MATTTATILVGHAHPNQGGINPTHLIRFTENNRPALILQPLDGGEEAKIIIPTIENTVDDIYLMISIYILQKVKPTKNLNNNSSLYEIFDEKERQELYEETKKIIEKTELKVVFNILDNSHLLNQIEAIKQYPNDFEITTPLVKKEYDRLAEKVIFKEF